MTLTDAQRQELTALSRRRTVQVRVAQRARIVLRAAAGWQDVQIAAELGCGRQCVKQWRRRFLKSGVAGLLKDKPRGGRPATLRDAVTQKIVELTTREQPDGQAGATRMGELVRGHWSVENQLHWCLDMSFHDDAARVCKDHGPQNLAAIKRLVLGLVKRSLPQASTLLKAKRTSLKTRRFLCGLDDAYLIRTLTAGGQG